MAAELCDIYNADRERTGKVIERKGTNGLSAGEYCLIVHVCIFNSKGEMLIQQRQAFKHYFANFWDITVGGAVMAGETSAQAGERETFEELGQGRFARRRLGRYGRLRGDNWTHYFWYS